MDTKRGWTELRPFLGADGRLTAFPAKQKKKLLALRYPASQIAPGRTYTEPELNDLLNEWPRTTRPPASPDGPPSSSYSIICIPRSAASRSVQANICSNSGVE